MNIDDDGVCVPKTAEELKVELDVFQMCVANFAEFDLELDAEVQVTFYQALFSLDFTTIEIGGLADIFTAEFKALVPADIDFSILVTSDTFITLETLIDVLLVMDAEGKFITYQVGITNSELELFFRSRYQLKSFHGRLGRFCCC